MLSKYLSQKVQLKTAFSLKFAENNSVYETSTYPKSLAYPPPPCIKTNVIVHPWIDSLSFNIRSFSRYLVSVVSFKVLLRSCIESIVTRKKSFIKTNKFSVNTMSKDLTWVEFCHVAEQNFSRQNLLKFGLETVGK